MAKSLEDKETINWYVDQCVSLWGLGAQAGNQLNTEDRNPYWFKDFTSEKNPFRTANVTTPQNMGDNFSKWFIQTAGASLLWRCGVTPVNYQSHPRNPAFDGILGHFLPDYWCVKMLETRVTDIMEYSTFSVIVTLTYHECRHAEQFFRIAQCLSGEMATKQSWEESVWRTHFKNPFVSNKNIKTPQVKGCVSCGLVFSTDTKKCKKCEADLPESQYYFTKNWSDFENYEMVKDSAVKNDRTPNEIIDLIGNATKIHRSVVETAVANRQEIPVALADNNFDKVFKWYDSYMGMSSVPRALILDEVTKENKNVWDAYQNLAEEADAYALQKLVDEALSAKIEEV